MKLNAVTGAPPVLLVCLATLAGTEPVQAHKLGDVNGDGIVDICDAVLILNHVQGVTAMSTNQLALPLADVDRNGFINFADFQRVVDIMLDRRAIQDFDLNLLSSDQDGDGLSFLEEF